MPDHSVEPKETDDVDVDLSSITKLEGKIKEVAQRLYKKSGGEGRIEDLEDSLEEANDAGLERATPCEKCDRRGQRASGLYCTCEYGRERLWKDTQSKKEVFEHAGLPKRLRGCTLQSWDALTGKDPGKRKARELVGEIVEHGVATGPSGIERPGLIIHGENGLGKSGLMAGLLRKKYRAGFPVLWIKWDDMVADIQATYGHTGQGKEGISTEGLVSTAQNTPLLFLDDLGEPFRPKSDYRVSEDARSITWRVLSTRHENEWPTFITSNHEGLAQISDQFSPRIADRLMELCTIVEMEGSNLRHPQSKNG